MFVLVELFDAICGLICRLGGVSGTVISKAVKFITKEKAKNEATPHHFIRIATEDDFEEAREKMSGEYSNLPVGKIPVFANPFEKEEWKN